MIKYYLVLVTILTFASCDESTNLSVEDKPNGAKTTAGCYDNMTYWDTGFEESTLNWHLAKHSYVASNVEMVNERARSGSKSLKFTWRQSEYTGPGTTNANNSCHSEVFSCSMEGVGQERWLGYSMYLPGAQMRNDSVVNLWQWHGYVPPNSGPCYMSPPFAFELRKDSTIHVYARTASNMPTTFAQKSGVSISEYVFPLAGFDQWVDFVIHIKFGSNNNGILEIWQNGSKVVNLPAKSIGYPDGNEYLKFGLYCWAADAIPNQVFAKPVKVVYFDSIKDANSTAAYATVAPGSENGTMKPKLN